jgi:hypothetical protein
LRMQIVHGIRRSASRASADTGCQSSEEGNATKLQTLQDVVTHNSHATQQAIDEQRTSPADSRLRRAHHLLRSVFQRPLLLLRNETASSRCSTQNKNKNTITDTQKHRQTCIALSTRTLYLSSSSMPSSICRNLQNCTCINNQYKTVPNLLLLARYLISEALLLGREPAAVALYGFLLSARLPHTLRTRGRQQLTHTHVIAMHVTGANITRQHAAKASPLAHAAAPQPRPPFPRAVRTAASARRAAAAARRPAAGYGMLPAARTVAAAAAPPPAHQADQRLGSAAAASVNVLVAAGRLLVLQGSKKGEG